MSPRCSRTGDCPARIPLQVLRNFPGEVCSLTFIAFLLDGVDMFRRLNGVLGADSTLFTRRPSLLLNFDAMTV